MAILRKMRDNFPSHHHRQIGVEAKSGKSNEHYCYSNEHYCYLVRNDTNFRRFK